MGKVIIKKTTYKGWENCISLTNGSIEIIAVTDVGPRIIRFGFVNQDNLFYEFEDQVGSTGGDDWKVYGGHRLWHSPEHMPRTYMPDNSPVQWNEIENGLDLLQDIEHWSHIRKEMTIRLSPDTDEVCIKHRITNTGAWTIELSAWALSIMAAGGIEYVPRNQKDTGLLPNQSLALWPYTKLNDSRITWGEKYIVLKQDAKVDQSFKIGLPNPSGWAAYLNFGTLFVKRYIHYEDAVYPDFGSSFETYTNSKILEIETLGPLVKLNPGCSLDHVEDWSLHSHVEMPKDENDIDKFIKPLICK